MVRLVLRLVRLEEREELVRARGGSGLALGRGRGLRGEGGLDGVPCGKLAREVGGERGRLGGGREGVRLDDADVGVLGLVALVRVRNKGECKRWGRIDGGGRGAIGNACFPEKPGQNTTTNRGGCSGCKRKARTHLDGGLVRLQLLKVKVLDEVWARRRTFSTSEPPRRLPRDVRVPGWTHLSGRQRTSRTRTGARPRGPVSPKPAKISVSQRIRICGDVGGRTAKEACLRTAEDMVDAEEGERA